MQVVVYEDGPSRFRDLSTVIGHARLRVVDVVRDPGALARSVRDRQPDGVVAAIGQERFERSIDRLEWVLALLPVLIVTSGRPLDRSTAGSPGGPVYLALPATAHQIRAAAAALRDHPVRHVPPSGTLTSTEAQIMNLVAAGHRNRDIAKELNMSLGTVKNRLFTAYCRLQAPNRAAAVTAWLRTPGGSR